MGCRMGIGCPPLVGYFRLYMRNDIFRSVIKNFIDKVLKTQMSILN